MKLKKITLVSLTAIFIMTGAACKDKEKKDKNPLTFGSMMEFRNIKKLFYRGKYFKARREARAFKEKHRNLPIIPAVDVIIDLSVLHDKSVKNKIRAIRSLGEITDKKLVLDYSVDEHLRQVAKLDSSDRALKKAAREALKKLLEKGLITKKESSLK